MTEKQFVEIDDGLDFSIKHIESGEVFYDCESVVGILNELAQENQQLKKELEECKNNKLFSRRELEKQNKELKSILQDMSLIMSNEEVKNVRDEIASKLIKPLCKGNGFDVDVNTENGFTIIPKGVNNDRE